MRAHVSHHSELIALGFNAYPVNCLVISCLFIAFSTHVKPLFIVYCLLRICPWMWMWITRVLKMKRKLGIYRYELLLLYCYYHKF